MSNLILDMDECKQCRRYVAGCYNEYAYSRSRHGCIKANCVGVLLPSSVTPIHAMQTRPDDCCDMDKVLEACIKQVDDDERRERIMTRDSKSWNIWRNMKGEQRG